MASSIGFRIFSYLPSCYSSYGAWTFTPVGLAPTDHASLRWTHTSRDSFAHSIGREIWKIYRYLQDQIELEANLHHPYDADKMFLKLANPAGGNWRDNGPEMLNSV
jgi:hypothetical protein